MPYSFTVDCASYQLSIPEDKIARYLGKVREVLRADVVTLEDLQSVNGNLKFLC